MNCAQEIQSWCGKRSDLKATQVIRRAKFVSLIDIFSFNIFFKYKFVHKESLYF